MTIERKIQLMTVPRNEAGFPSLEILKQSVEERLAELRELEKECLVEVKHATEEVSSNYSDAYNVEVTPKGRAFLKEHHAS